MDSTTNRNHYPPSAPCTHIWKYDVFLSFRGEDTRKTFTDHLYDALTRARIRTFRDDSHQVQRGRDISFELLKAIEESRVSIVIFSKNYAFSTWCLNELVKILECMKTRGQLVLPLFYNVDPSDVHKRKRSFGEAFTAHEGLSGDGFEDQVQRWRCALTEAANLSGWDLRTDADGYESKLINKVVREVQFSIASDNMVALEEEEARLLEGGGRSPRGEDEGFAEKDGSHSFASRVLSSKRANLVARRSSLEEMKRQFGSDEELRLLN